MNNVDIEPSTVIEYANNMRQSLEAINSILNDVNNVTSTVAWDSKAAETYKNKYNEFKNNNYNQFNEVMNNCINYLINTANAYIEAEDAINGSAE